MTNSVSSINTQKYSIASFFAGVGGIELGFEQTGKFRVVYANEFDKNARKTYAKNNPDTLLDGRDIHEVSTKEIPNCDVIMGGFPCQAFSIAGYRKGFEDERGNLFFEMLRIIKAKKPRVVFIENVKNLVTHDHGNTFKVIREALVENGYYIKWHVLNGKDYGNVPQNRERIYIVGFKYATDYVKFNFPDPIKLTKTIHDIIDFDGTKDEKYYYKRDKQTFYDNLVNDMTSHDTIYQWRRQYVRENKAGVVPTLTANMGTGGHNVPLILTNSDRIRKLTPKETFNAQGYPETFKLPDIANGQLYKQAGNSVVVPVIHRIALQICKAINDQIKIDDNRHHGRYALIYSNIGSHFEGESYVKEYSDSIDNLKKIVLESEKNLLSDDEYLKLVQKKKSASFYMIEKI
ncbi:DNA cytosine methyltransferase [Liquorilactobacillus uvarum]|nr:DNA cytosine methyltransferase [Liquorilactobacillus uvarum]